MAFRDESWMDLLHYRVGDMVGRLPNRAYDHESNRSLEWVSQGELYVTHKTDAGASWGLQVSVSINDHVYSIAPGALLGPPFRIHNEMGQSMVDERWALGNGCSVEATAIESITRFQGPRKERTAGYTIILAVGLVRRHCRWRAA